MSNQQQLPFQDETQAAFAFLEESYLFTRTLGSVQKVRYESQKAYIEVNYGDYDFEITLTFGRLHRSEPEQFDFTLFLRLVNPSLEKDLGERIADKPEKVCQTIQKLASVLRSEGMDIIEGNDSVFDRMKTVTWWQFRPDALKDEDRKS